MEFGFRRIFWSILILVVIVIVSQPVVARVSTTNLFGCKFLNTVHYPVNIRPDGPRIVYGDEIESVEVSQELMETFIQNVTRKTKSLLETEILDNWLPYSDLYAKYVEFGEKYQYFIYFFSDVQLGYLPNTDYSQVISIFNHLIKTDYEGIKNKIFLVPVIVGYDETVLIHLHEYKHLPSRLFEHVAGVFPFILNGQEGYVVMDPGFGLPKPVVVFKDGTISEDFPNTASTSQLNPAGDTVHMRYTEEIFPFKLIIAEIKNPDGEIIHRNFYSVKAPYCSFMKHTANIQALKTTGLKVARRDRKGLPIAAVSVDLLPLPHELTFKIDIYEQPPASTKISFRNFASNNLTESEFGLLGRVNDLIYTPDQSLIARMRALTNSANNIFLTHVKQLYEDVTARKLTATIE